MSKTEQEHREDLVRVCHQVYEKGWVAANDGNVSIRLSEDLILCTPTAVSKGMVKAEDLIVCDMGGTKVRGQRACTSEIAMHTTIYSLRPDVHAVVHAHPPVATGFATAGRALDKALLPEVIIQLGAVPLAQYGLPGTPALSDGMLPFIPHYDALLLENHGARRMAPMCGRRFTGWRRWNILRGSRLWPRCWAGRRPCPGRSRKAVCGTGAV